ncbi:hypothetical protein IWW54_004585, partial [Coemansia sp. RSA 2705]
MDFSRSHARLGASGPHMVKTYGRFKQRIVNRETKGVQEFARVTSARPILADILDSSSDSSDFEEFAAKSNPSASQSTHDAGKENAGNRTNVAEKTALPDSGQQPQTRRGRTKQQSTEDSALPTPAGKLRSKERKAKPKATPKIRSERKAHAARSAAPKDSLAPEAILRDGSIDTRSATLAVSVPEEPDTAEVSKKALKEPVRACSNSSTHKPRPPRTRTRKRTVTKSSSKAAKPDDSADDAEWAVQTLEPAALTQNEPSEIVLVDPAPDTNDNQPAKPDANSTDTATSSMTSNAEKFAAPDSPPPCADERLAAFAQSPLSSGKVTRRKASRVRRSALNPSLQATSAEKSPILELDAYDLAPERAKRCDSGQPENACEQQPADTQADGSSPAAAIERVHEFSEPVEPAKPVELIEPAATVEPNEPVELIEPTATVEPNEPVEQCEALAIPNNDEDDNDFIDDCNRSRQHLATRAMRFKAPRNARAQTYEIDDVPEPNSSEIPSTPPRRCSAEKRELIGTVQPILTQGNTQEYDSPPRQEFIPEDLLTLTPPSRNSRASIDRPRASLAATQLITKEKLTATAAIPHSPSRVATPHRVVYSPTRRPSAAQTTHGPKRNTINGAAMMLERLVSKHEDRHRTSLPAPRQSLSKERSSCDGAHEPEIEETKVPFLPARRYVQKAHILAACGQTAPIDWVSGGLQACGVLLPNLDPTQHSQEQMNELESDAGLCKIGEATYSEVFSAQWRYVPRTRYDKFNSKKGAVKGERLMQVALKIIPFGNSSVKSGTGETQTTLRDLYQEIGATLALSRLSERERGKLQEARTQVKMPLKPKERELGANFVKAFRVCICQGPLPEPLLRAWDRWQGEYPDLCENSRPDYYPANQLFAVFVLEMGGETLENANVATWKEARSIIRQLALSMALAERNNRFEHRDLHWGNIMVTRYNSNLTFLYQLPPTGSRHKSTLISIPSYRVRCTIIDYTLSRLHIDNDDAEGVSKPASYDPSNNVFYVALKDQALFQGQGDIQFDVYRQMRGCAHDDWEGFHPHTNVLWLTYVLQKILTTKSPAIRDELMAFAETKLGSPPESVSLEVRRAAAQELLRRWMHEFEQ